MPLAGGKTVGEVRVFQLKTCPPDGFIKIKRLSYGDKMFRRSLMGKATVKTGGGNRSRRGDFIAEMELINERVTMFEMSRSIVDHNLTILLTPGDESSEVPVDFSNPVHVKLLDGAVGEEIDSIIMEFNEFEDDEDTEK